MVGTMEQCELSQISASALILPAPHLIIHDPVFHQSRPLEAVPAFNSQT